MWLDWARFVGSALAFLFTLGSTLRGAGLILAAFLGVWAAFAFYTGDIPRGIAVLAACGLVVVTLQAGNRGDWLRFVPHVALVLMAASVGYGVHLYASGQGVLIAETPRTPPAAPETVEADHPLRTAVLPEETTAPASTPELAPSPAPISATQGPATPEPAAPEAAAQERPSAEERAEAAQALWAKVDEGRGSAETEPERTALIELLRDGQSLARRDLSFLTLSRMRLLGEPLSDGGPRTGLDLEGVQLYGARLECSDLEGARLSSAVFAFPQGLRDALDESDRYTDARFANFRSADLTGVEAEDTDFRFANFENVRFGAADLARAVLDYANLAGADLSAAQGLTRAQLRHACVSSQTQLPQAITDADEGPVPGWSGQCVSYWGESDRPAQPTDYPFARYERADGDDAPQDPNRPAYFCG